MSARGVERWRFSRASISLTSAGFAFAALGLVTGPLLARALGPAGRGELAAIVVPLTLAPWIALFGQQVFAARQAARGNDVGVLVFSLGALLVSIGTLVALAGIPISSHLAGDRPVVRTFLLIGFATMPIVLVGLLLLGISEGLERWRSVIAWRIVPGGIVLAGVVALFVTSTLTVSSAAVLYLIAPLAGVLCVAPVLRNRRYRFDLSLLREAVPFGAKAWTSDTADVVNARLDQLLMITLVSQRELGLYAVAVNLCSFGTLISGGMSPPLLARISAGEIGLAPRALRTLLALLALLTLLVAAVTPPLLELLFGEQFSDAAEPTWVLLAAGLPLAGKEILTQALNGVGRPGLPAVGQGVAVIITVPGLLLLLPAMGIVGAAAVSLVAYTANFLILLVATIRICDMTASELLVPKRSDVLWFRNFVRSRIRPSSGSVA